MTPEEEVLKVKQMLEGAGFKPLEAIFKGVIAVSTGTILKEISDLAEKGDAIGSILIIYQAGEKEIRSIEIPVGRKEQPTQAAPQ